MPKGGRWHDLDLEEVITLRRKTLSEAERNEFEAMNFFDNELMCRLDKTHLPLRNILEGVLMSFLKGQMQ